MTNIKKFFLGTMVVAIMVVSLAAASRYFLPELSLFNSSKNASYLIPGVPYVGMHNHKGGENYRIMGDTPSAIISVLEYWDPGKNSFGDVTDYIRGGGTRFVGGGKIKSLIESKEGYRFKEINIGEIKDLKRYINPKQRTPLIAFLPIGTDQPKEITYYPASVIIGIDDSRQKVIAHSYFLGNNYEMSFDDFRKLLDLKKESDRNQFFVIQPTDMNSKLSEISSRIAASYPARTQIMKEAEGMIRNYAYGNGATMLKLNDLALEYFMKSGGDVKFEEFMPPTFKVSTLTGIGRAYLEKGDTQNALIYAQKAYELDHDLDKPFKDWPGYDYRSSSSPAVGVDSIPIANLGNVYLKMNDYAKAAEYYRKALNINPENRDAISGMALLAEYSYKNINEQNQQANQNTNGQQ